MAAVFDGEDKLPELLITYRPNVNLLFPTPADLAHGLEESGLRPGKGPEASGFPQVASPLGGQTLEMVLCVPNSRLGALVRLRAER